MLRNMRELQETVIPLQACLSFWDWQIVQKKKDFCKDMNDYMFFVKQQPIFS